MQSIAPSLVFCRPRLFHVGRPNSFHLVCYKQALPLPSSFPISGLSIHKVTQRFTRYFTRDLASIHPLVLSVKEVLLACLYSSLELSLQRNARSLFSSAFFFNLLFVKALPSPFLTSDSRFCDFDLLLSSCGKEGSGVIASCSLCFTEFILIRLAQFVPIFLVNMRSLHNLSADLGSANKTATSLGLLLGS